MIAATVKRFSNRLMSRLELNERKENLQALKCQAAQLHGGKRALKNKNKTLKFRHHSEDERVKKLHCQKRDRQNNFYTSSCKKKKKKIQAKSGIEYS